MSLEIIREINEKHDGFVKLVGQSQGLSTDFRLIQPVLKFDGIQGFLIDGKWKPAPFFEKVLHYERFLAVFDEGNPSTHGAKGDAEYILSSKFVQAKYINQSGLDLCKLEVLKLLTDNKGSGQGNTRAEQALISDVAHMKPGAFRTALSTMQGARTLIPLILNSLPVYGLRCQIMMDESKPRESWSQFMFLNKKGIAKMQGFVA